MNPAPRQPDLLLLLAASFFLFTSSYPVELRADLSGGSGLSDPEYIFYFRCRPEDTEELIRTLRLAPDPFDEDLLTAPVDKSWPDPATWPGSRIYRGGPEDGSWWYYLRTDATREQVYFLSGHS